MGDITITGVPVVQRKQIFITGSISAKDLLKIYEVDEWKRGRSIETQGCQRPPIKSHYQRIGRQLKDDVRTKLPTSITLSANNNEENPDKNTVQVEMNQKLNVMTIRIPSGNKLKIVDGQHRVLGAKYAIEELKANDIKDFQFAFVLMIANDRLEEIRTFYDINTTSKKVSTDLALQLLNDWNNNTHSKLTKTEKWKLVALNIAITLNDDPKSLWHKCIYMGNSKESGIITSTAFVKSLGFLLNGLSFIKKDWENAGSEAEAGKKIAGLVNNFWEGLRFAMPNMFPEDLAEKDEWFVQKNVGVQVWHAVAPFILEECMLKREKIKDLTAANIGKFIKNYAGYGVDDAELVWEARNSRKGLSGGEAASASSTKAYNEIARNIKNDIEANYVGLGKESVNY